VKAALPSSQPELTQAEGLPFSYGRSFYK
jgi:hypothetical protein